MFAEYNICISRVNTMNDALLANISALEKSDYFCTHGKGTSLKISFNPIASHTQKLNSWLVGTVCEFRSIFSLFLSIFLQQ